MYKDQGLKIVFLFKFLRNLQIFNCSTRNSKIHAKRENLKEFLHLWKLGHMHPVQRVPQ